MVRLDRMAIDWSENIVLAQLTDEPSLSEELTTLFERLEAIDPEEEHPSVVLDFSAVSYVNSSNIAQMLRLSKQVSRRGKALRLCSISDEVASVMSVTGLDKVFSFAPDTLTALASIQLEEDGDEF